MAQCKPAIDGLEGYPYLIHCEETDTAIVSLGDSRVERRPVDSPMADPAESSTHNVNAKGKGKTTNLKGKGKNFGYKGRNKITKAKGYYGGKG
eukprot:5124260-Karenia_brevis.AAC.1